MVFITNPAFGLCRLNIKMDVTSRTALTGLEKEAEYYRHFSWQTSLKLA